MDFDKKNLEQTLADLTKSSALLVREITKFKSEYFVASDSVVNKDMCLLKVQFVKQQGDKMSKVAEKLIKLESQVSESLEQFDETKQTFEELEKTVFDVKMKQIQQIGFKCNLLSETITQLITECTDKFTQCKQVLGQMQVFTKDQRSLLAEVNVMLGRVERKLQKCSNTFENLSTQQVQLAQKDQQCQDITSGLKPQEIKGMLNQTKQLDKLMECCKQGASQQAKLEILEDEVRKLKGEFDLIFDKTQDLNAKLQAALKLEFEALTNQISDRSSNIYKVVQKQLDRLREFDSKISQSQIPENDLVMIRKDLDRHQEMLVLVENQTDKLQENMNDLKDQIDLRDEQIVETCDLDMAKQGVKTVDKLLNQDLPRLVKMIDKLEQAIQKSLRGQLGEDNKKSQLQISKMKKAFEELQKMIEAVNQKFGDCRTQINNIDEMFETDDLERINEITRIDELLQEEELNIYGIIENDEKPPPSELSESLQKMKKDIIQQINSLVLLFNENNRQIKEQNQSKQAADEKVINDLIFKNQQLQQDCQAISSKVDYAKDFCKQISERLDTIVNPEVVGGLKQKYKDKYECVQQCEQSQIKVVTQMEKLDAMMSKNFTLIDDLTSKLDKVNPGSEREQKEEFREQVNKNQDELALLKEELEGFKRQLGEFVEEVENTMQPLSILEEQEVKLNPQIQGILDTLQKIEQELINLENKLNPINAQLPIQVKNIKQLVDSEIARKLGNGLNIISDLEQINDSSNELGNQANKRLKYYKDLISQAIKKQGDQDPLLKERLIELNDEALIFEKDISEGELKVKDLKKKTVDAKKAVSDIQKNPEKYLPQQLDNMLQNLDELQDKINSNKLKFNETDKSIQKKIEDLQKLLETSDSKQEIQILVEEIYADVGEDLVKLLQELDKLPITIGQVKQTLEEESKDTGDGGDYKEDKHIIKQLIEDLDELLIEANEMKKAHKTCLNAKNDFKLQTTKTMNLDNLKRTLDNMHKQKDNVTNIFTDLHAVDEQITQTKNQMGDCSIPVNISKRKTDMFRINTKLGRLTKDFQNLSNTKNKGAAQEIKSKMQEIESKLNQLTSILNGPLQKQLKELESTKPVEYVDFNKNYSLIKKIRELKNQMHEQDENLKEVDLLLKEVMRMLTEQDMENSVHMVGMQSQQLNERLKIVEEQLKTINRSGEEMDGNCSNDDEEEFIFALKKDMPDVFENISVTFKLLKEINNLVLEVKHTMDPDKMMELQSKVNVATENVEQSETLKHQLTSQMIDMNPQQKLARRDDELHQINTQCMELLEELAQEKSKTQVEIDKNLEKQAENRGQEMVNQNGEVVDIMGDLISLEAQMKEYIKEVEDLKESGTTLEGFYVKCFDEFSADLPLKLLELRKIKQDNLKNKDNLKRPPQFLSTNKKKPQEKKIDENDQEGDMLTMVTINCKYRKRIKNLLAQLEEIILSRKDLHEKYKEMRRQIFEIKQIKLYKPVKGDVVDEMFAGYLNKAKLEIEVQRISANNYLFGSKRILAKIINNRLVIRVGGGYMNAEEFIEQYGKIEMMKMMKMEEHQRTQALYGTAGADAVKSDIRNSETQHSNIQASMANHLKEQMRQQMLNVQTYSTDGSSMVKSMRNTNTKNMVRNSMTHDSSSTEELKAALDNMKQNLTLAGATKTAAGKRMSIMVTPSAQLLQRPGTTMASKQPLTPTREEQTLTKTPSSSNFFKSKIGAGAKKEEVKKSCTKK